MPTYKLIYFNARGYGELARLLFAVAGVPYEDIRVERANWPNEYKAICPFGQMPLLEVDGKILAQSSAIARYLAMEFGMAGKDNWEQARIDMVVDSFGDILQDMRVPYLETDPEKKEALVKQFVGESLPKRLGYLENILKENGGGQGFIVGDSLTWADLGVANSVDYLKLMCPNPFENFPLLAGLVQRVREIPQVAAWIAKRPETAT